MATEIDHRPMAPTEWTPRRTRRMLTSDDEGVHQPGSNPTWNESRCVDFYDSQTDVGAGGKARNWIPLRHVAPDSGGALTTLRIVKSPVVWKFDDGRAGSGAAEIHDRLDSAGVPAGLHD